jgi:hypothetical protein
MHIVKEGFEDLTVVSEDMISEDFEDNDDFEDSTV